MEVVRKIFETLVSKKCHGHEIKLEAAVVTFYFTINFFKEPWYYEIVIITPMRYFIVFINHFAYIHDTNFVETT